MAKRTNTLLRSARCRHAFLYTIAFLLLGISASSSSTSPSSSSSSSSSPSTQRSPPLPPTTVPASPHPHEGTPPEPPQAVHASSSSIPSAASPPAEDTAPGETERREERHAKEEVEEERPTLGDADAGTHERTPSEMQDREVKEHMAPATAAEKQGKQLPNQHTNGHERADGRQEGDATLAAAGEVSAPPPHQPNYRPDQKNQAAPEEHAQAHQPDSNASAAPHHRTYPSFLFSWY